MPVNQINCCQTTEFPGMGKIMKRSMVEPWWILPLGHLKVVYGKGQEMGDANLL